MAMAAAYPDVLREILSIPASKKIICGIAIGYADEDSPAARFRSEREPFETFVTWRRDG
jgi:nitroreductase